MKKYKITLVLILSLIICNQVIAQNAINISLSAINIENLDGRQSFAVGQANGKWLIIGGRTDGLHRRQPFASFDTNGQPNELLVIDPVSKQKWTANLSILPIAIQEALKATNIDFIQNNNQLYLIGGYGYSNTFGDHTTFNTLTAIAVSETISAIVSNNNYSNYIRQTSNSIFQNTGGQLEKINDSYYLIGGQDFQGRYNPMGPTHGPGFTQTYSNQIRKFNILDNGTLLGVNNISIITDSVNLHRRDYNALPQILPNLSQGITAYSGVFQQNVDLPYLNAVTIDSLSYIVNNNFNQYYNHYHCANIPLYSASRNEMHALFFGGIAQYYDSLGILVQDNNVPFVKTIARVTRDVNGTLAEYKLPIEMPALLGAGAEFIYRDNLPVYTNGVIKMDELSADSTVLGYIYGGINSSAKNIFWINDGSQSASSANIYKVTLHRNALTGIDHLNSQSMGTIKLMVYPNPNTGIFIAQYHLIKPTDVKITLSNVNGKIIDEQILINQQIGAQVFERKIKHLENGGVYFIKIETAYENAFQKIVIEP
jgi:hypothetical protein